MFKPEKILYKGVLVVMACVLLLSSLGHLPTVSAAVASDPTTIVGGPVVEVISAPAIPLHEIAVIAPEESVCGAVSGAFFSVQGTSAINLNQPANCFSLRLGQVGVGSVAVIASSSTVRIAMAPTAPLVLNTVPGLRPVSNTGHILVPPVEYNVSGTVGKFLATSSTISVTPFFQTHNKLTRSVLSITGILLC